MPEGKCRKIVLLLTLFVMSLPVSFTWAGNRDECSDAASTIEIEQCYAKAYEKWDKELNVIYQKLVKELSKADKAALQESQRKWIAFRDSEILFYRSLFTTEKGGTLSGIQFAVEKSRLTRDRVLALKSYYCDVNPSVAAGDCPD